VARRARQLAKLEQNPKSVSPEQLMATIEAFGFEKARQRGSHLFYRHSETGAIIAFPYRRPHISAVYVKRPSRF
jgi:predicted RNA binding protein YcfA (HicA-like mRNA interferase family)